MSPSLSKAANLLANLAIVVVAYFTPIHSLLGLTVVLILADMILGILASRKRGEKIESQKLRRTISKIVFYELAVLMAFIIDTNFSLFAIGISVKLVGIAAAVIGLTEVKSIFENLGVLTGVDFLQAVLSKLAPPPQPPKDPNG